MLYLIFGKDTIKSKNRLKELKRIWTQKYPSCPILVFDEDNFSLEEVQNLAKTKSLFYEKQLIVFNRILEKKETAEQIIKELALLDISKNVFIFWEENINPDAIKSFEENKSKIETFPIKEEVEKYKKNRIFYQLTDALFEKRKRLATGLFYKMLANDISADDIFWHIWWAFKNLGLVLIYKNEDENAIIQKTGLNPFVVKKGLLAGRLISQEKIETALKELVLNYNYCRLGFREMDKELELLLLRF